MDRASGKTQDCFVEFFSVEDARVWDRSIRGRGSQYNRIGDRLIEVSLSNQDDLLRELFPRAKSVVWEGGNPKILTPEEPYNTGFKTFLSAEELQIHVRHAEQPQRVSIHLFQFSLQLSFLLDGLSLNLLLVELYHEMPEPPL